MFVLHPETYLILNWYLRSKEDYQEELWNSNITSIRCFVRNSVFYKKLEYNFLDKFQGFALSWNLKLFWNIFCLFDVLLIKCWWFRLCNVHACTSWKSCISVILLTSSGNIKVLYNSRLVVASCSFLQEIILWYFINQTNENLSLLIYYYARIIRNPDQRKGNTFCPCISIYRAFIVHRFIIHFKMYTAELHKK